MKASITTIAVLSVFVLNDRYFLELHHSNPGRHFTFRTAEVEPKQQVFELLAAKANAEPQRHFRIFVQGFWIQTPLRYYLFPLRNQVEILDFAALDADRAALRAFFEEGAVMIIESPSGYLSVLDTELRGREVKKTIITDYTHDPVIQIWEK